MSVEVPGMVCVRVCRGWQEVAASEGRGMGVSDRRGESRQLPRA